MFMRSRCKGKVAQWIRGTLPRKGGKKKLLVETQNRCVAHHQNCHNHRKHDKPSSVTCKSQYWANTWHWEVKNLSRMLLKLWLKRYWPFLSPKISWYSTSDECFVIQFIANLHKKWVSIRVKRKRRECRKWKHFWNKQKTLMMMMIYFSSILCKILKTGSNCKDMTRRRYRHIHIHNADLPQQTCAANHFILHPLIMRGFSVTGICFSWESFIQKSSKSPSFGWFKCKPMRTSRKIVMSSGGKITSAHAPK